MKKFRHVLLAVAFVFCTTAPAVASDDFSTEFYSVYDIDQQATTTITHRVVLTNKKTDVFASSYAIAVGSTFVKNARAFGSQGTYDVSTQQADNLTIINVNLEKYPVIGKDKRSEFTISYQSSDIASHVGKVLEINIPKVSDAESFSIYEVIIKAPKTFDPPTSTIPSPTLSTLTDQKYVLSFKNYTGSGITAVFGTSQLFKLNLSYHLENTTETKTSSTITLVPDTAYQKVSYGFVDPRPDALFRDNDGNWIASFALDPKETINVSAQATVEVFMKPTVSVPSTEPSLYLGPSKYWQTEDLDIEKIAKDLKSARNIYDYVVRQLTYDYSRIDSDFTRLGAIAALAQPEKSMCTEFTDLFIALARAADIPARELNGYAFTKNPKLRPIALTKDILHAWPEYWDDDQNQWVPIDPTWENTTRGIDYFSKLDLNHIVFAIHGTSATDPLPAGFFKTNEIQGKTVYVEPTAQQEDDTRRLQFSSSVPKQMPTSRFSLITVTVKNAGSQALYSVPFSVSMPYKTQKPIDDHIPVILPMQTIVIPINAKPVDAWKSGKYDVRVTIGDETETYETTTTVLVSRTQATFLAIAGGGFLVVLFAIFARRLYFSKRRA